MFDGDPSFRPVRRRDGYLGLEDVGVHVLVRCSAVGTDPMRKPVSSLVGVGVRASVSLLAFAAPALGIGFGERDNFRHPNVVSRATSKPIWMRL